MPQAPRRRASQSKPDLSPSRPRSSSSEPLSHPERTGALGSADQLTAVPNFRMRSRSALSVRRSSGSAPQRSVTHPELGTLGSYRYSPRRCCRSPSDGSSKALAIRDSLSYASGNSRANGRPNALYIGKEFGTGTFEVAARRKIAASPVRSSSTPHRLRRGSNFCLCNRVYFLIFCLLRAPILQIRPFLLQYCRR